MTHKMLKLKVVALVFTLILSPSLQLSIVKNGEVEKVDMEFEEAVKFLQLEEIQKLKETVTNLRNEKKKCYKENTEKIDQIKTDNEKVLNSLTEQLENVQQTVANQEVLLGFLRSILYYIDVKKTTCMDAVQAQAEEIAILGAERAEYQKKNELNLKHAYLQVDIIKSQEKEKKLLKETVITQQELFMNYGNLTGFTELENFPKYAQLLTQTLANQASKIEQMSQYFKEEKKVEENMAQILNEIQNLNFSLATQTSKWDLLTQYQNVISIQNENLKALGPAISYVIEDNKRFQYNFDDEGTLLSLEPCQCLPDPKESGILVSEIEFVCPNGMVSATSLEAELTVPCPGGDCPDEVDLGQCGDFTELPWGPWEDCTEERCLVESIRKRKVRTSQGVSFEFQGNGSQAIILTESYEFDINLSEGTYLAIFAMGGGGGADDSVSGSSGFFQYSVQQVTESRVFNVAVTIGAGGDNTAGRETVVTIPGFTTVTGKGGGYSAGPGWSGGSSEKGGWNGGNGASMSNGSGEKLPTVCGNVKIEASNTGDYDSDGTGGGGVKIDGKEPPHLYRRNGYGYGAGGGEDDYDGTDGVVVIMLCYGDEPGFPL